MQANSPGATILNTRYLRASQAQAQPTTDTFQAMLQKRLVSQRYSKASTNKSSISQKTSNSRRRQNFPASRGETLRSEKAPEVISAKAAKGGLAKASDPKPTKGGSQWSRVKTSGEQREMAAALVKAGVPPEQVKKWLAAAAGSNNQLAEGEASAVDQGTAPENFQEFLKFTPKAAASSESSVASLLSDQLTQASANSADAKLPPGLRQLLSFLEQTPLKVSPEGQAEIAALLINSGLPQKQVEQLLNSPGVQQNGLTAEDLKSCWLKTVQGTQSEGPANAARQLGQNVPQDSKLSRLTSDPGYQRQWSRLTVPAGAWGQLRLELQRLGVQPEVLAAVEEQASTNGLPLTQVWEMIRQSQGAGQGADQAQAQPQAKADGSVTVPPFFQGAAQELEGWRQILVQAGLNPQVAQALLGSQEPGNTETLKERLLQVAPATPAPQALDGPKPLYLPDNLRLKVLALEEKTPSDQQPAGEKGQSQANLNMATGGKTPNLTPPPTLGAETQEVSLPPLPGGSPVSFHVPATAGTSNPFTESPYAFLSPEVRQAMWSQLQEGILSNLTPGETQVKLSLQPPELGHVLLTLNVKGDFVEVTAATSRPEVAQLAQAEVQQLVQSLSQQGLILTQFHVQVQDGGDRSALAASGPRQGGKKDEESKDKSTVAETSKVGEVDCFA
ncbi:MAG: flagellar hook-length control protein FliK [Thermodesulfobacteriota bacterium]